MSHRPFRKNRRRGVHLQDGRIKPRVISGLPELRNSILLQQRGYFPPHFVDQGLSADIPISTAVLSKKRFDRAVAQGEIQHVIVDGGFYEMAQATVGRNMQRDFDVRVSRLKSGDVIVLVVSDQRHVMRGEAALIEHSSQRLFDAAPDPFNGFSVVWIQIAHYQTTYRLDPETRAERINHSFVDIHAEGLAARFPPCRAGTDELQFFQDYGFSFSFDKDMGDCHHFPSLRKLNCSGDSKSPHTRGSSPPSNQAVRLSALNQDEDNSPSSKPSRNVIRSSRSISPCRTSAVKFAMTSRLWVSMKSWIGLSFIRAPTSANKRPRVCGF